MKTKVFYRIIAVVLFGASLFFAFRHFQAALIMFWYDTTGLEPKFRKDAVLSLLDAEGKSRGDFEVEIVDSKASIELGLMFRKQMAANRGMLFVFKDEKPRVFWMKNTMIPLDMVFLGADSSVVSVRSAEKIFSTKPVFSGRPARFVLELNLGTAKRIGLTEGDRMRLNR